MSDDDPGTGKNGPHIAERGSEAWRERRAADLLADRVLEGPGYLYRATEIVVDVEDEEYVLPRLPRDTKPDPDNGRLSAIGISRYELPEDVYIPEFVREVRASRDDGEPVGVSANTVLGGEPVYHGGPGGRPRPAGPLTFAEVSVEKSTRPDLAVLDTGYAVGLEETHATLFRRLRPDCNDADELFTTPGDPVLAFEAGHGTFIAGLVAQVAPDLAIDPGKVLSPAGIGDDVSIALELFEMKAPVINLSLGGYTQHDQPPTALAAAIRRLPPETVVVAAAGNNSSRRPFWPAALKNVIAVGALDTLGAAPVRADFSNHGWWVDVWAPGVSLRSSYVSGVWSLDPAGGDGEPFDAWACWNGTSFAAPLVAAEIARRAAADPTRSARVVAAEFLASLPRGMGLPFDAPAYLPANDQDLLCPRCAAGQGHG